MATKKYKQKLIKHRICSVARIIACVSFVVLTIIGVSSLVKAMSLESVEHQNGIPSSWKIASLGNPEAITVPISYWDQRQDDCSNENRQFEWTICQYWTAGALQGVVKDTLGSDGLPIPAYTNSTDAWAANHDVFTANVTGHDPVQSSDNFYRWFHNTSVSQQYDRKITFNRIGNNTYQYTGGTQTGQNVFPLDDVNFSNGDSASESGHSDDGKQHNFHFTAHLSIPVKIAADGSELFEFSGDDDVWVFLNGKLVLDIGGLHEALNGNFRINADGTITSYVQNVNDVSDREKLGKPGVWAYNYVNQLNEHNRKTYSDRTKTFDIGLKAGDVVNLDFFYAERSTTASNTKITISNMEWPISADSNVDGKIVGKLEDTNSNLVQYTTSITNRDPQFAMQLERMSVYLRDESKATDKDGNEQTFTNAGFIPLSNNTLSYTTTPDDESSWKPIEITPPMNSESGFTFNTPLTINPSGQAGDTIYFRYLADTSEYSGTISNRTSYYTNTDGVAGVTYDSTSLPYTGKTSIDDGGEEQPQNYQLNIEYQIDYEGQDPDPSITTPPSVHKELPNGESYSIPSPIIDGFTPDKSTVSGTIENSDANWVVIYKKKPVETPEKYKLTIHYVKTDGTEAFPDHVSEHNPEENITFPSPELPNYTRNPESVTVTVTDHDIEEYVYYTPIAIKHTVTVHYVYSDGATAFEDYIGEYAEGERFSINSPDKANYRKDIAVVSGVMSDHDRVFTVTYTPSSTPVGPTDPVDPTPDPTPTPTPDPDPTPTPNPSPSPTPDPDPDPSIPTEPTTPITPNIPEDNDELIPSIPVLGGDGDELIYLAPLGEVAFVPNTGVISEYIAPIFEQYFAEVVLSQTFVAVALLIFAGSFATYFSLRKYLDMNLAPATNYTKKTMPKSVANSKTARDMKRNAQKASIKSTKTSTKARKTSTKSPTKAAKSTRARKTSTSKTKK